jgi:hypothetical protein
VSDQGALFGGQPVGKPRLGPFVKGSETSRQAAIDNYPRSNTQRRRVLDAIVAAGEDGHTRDELSITLRLPINSVLPRVVELKRDGFVVESSKTRTTSTGSRATVLVVAPVEGAT